MKISDGEKLIIYMLADIMEAQKISGEIDPDFIKGALNSHSWSIKLKYSGIFHDEDDRPEDVEEVYEFMDMFRALKDGSRNIKSDTLSHYGVKSFDGFDGNNESAHYSIARYLVEEMGLYAEQKSAQFNSHCPMLPSYRAGLKAFKAGNRVRMSEDDVRKVLEAMNS